MKRCLQCGSLINDEDLFCDSDCEDDWAFMQGNVDDIADDDAVDRRATMNMGSDGEKPMRGEDV